MLVNSAHWDKIMGVLRQHVPQNTFAYLVGGAVRDLLRGKPLHDLDLVLQGNIRSTARRVADALGGDFYMLDEERDTARVIDHGPDGEMLYIDFCALRAPDLIADLVARDFTVNAIALDIRQPERLLDPTGGRADLAAGILRACTPQAFETDPVRVLRGVRQALSFGFSLDSQTAGWMQAAAPLLGRVSAERQRDEVFRMLEGGQAHLAIRQLDTFGVLAVLMPELGAMKGVTQSPPHTLAVWEHTLLLLEQLELLWEALLEDAEPAAGSWIAQAAFRLKDFRPGLREHFAAQINPNRSIRALLFLAALYHDAGKPLTRSVEPEGRIRYFGHEEEGAALAARRARALALSQDELQRVQTIVRQHMRMHHLDMAGRQPSRRSIFRFFRDCGPAGVEIILLTLADTLATYGAGLPAADWAAELETAGTLLQAWFDQPAEAVRPARLLGGEDLIRELGLAPGPRIGRLLAAIQEAQAAGEVTTREQAVDLARSQLKLEP